jgi:hypothetical protein
VPAVASAVLLSVLLPGTAAADEPAGTTVVGELVQAWAETAEHGSVVEVAPAPLSWVETVSGDAVPVASDDVAGLLPGSTVSVTVDGEPTEEGGTAHAVLEAEVLQPPAAQTAQVAPAGPVTNQVTVAMVAPAGTSPDPALQLAQVVDLVDGPVAEFWADETGGAVRVGVTTSRNWFATAAGCATPAALWSEAARVVGFEAGPGRHLMLVLPGSAPGCAYALAEVGSSAGSGGRFYVTDDSASVIAHELGHNFGLAHSSGAQCDGTVDSGTCRTVAYRDHYDVMGVSWERTGSLNVVQAAALGVLAEAQVQRVPLAGGPATVTLAPVSGRNGVRAVRLTDTAGVDHWLEYRPAAGRDAWLGTDADPFDLDTGVLLRRAGAFPDTSVLLDGSPSGAAGWDGDLQAALVPGSPVAVSGGQFTIEVTGITAEGAVVSVLPSPSAVAPEAPAPGAAAPAGAVLPGREAADSAGVPGEGADPARPGGPAELPVSAAAPHAARGPGAVVSGRPALAAAAASAVEQGARFVTVLGVALAGTGLLVARRARRVARR